MITLQQGIAKYLEKHPYYEVDTIFDVGDEWVVGACDKETGYEIDQFPIAVSKENGEMRVFMPHKNQDKTQKAIEIDIITLERKE